MAEERGACEDCGVETSGGGGMLVADAAEDGRQWKAKHFLPWVIAGCVHIASCVFQGLS